MATFHEQSTQHYIRSSQLFFSTVTKCPALFFMSKTDPVGPIKSNIVIRDSWDSAGIQVRFDGSIFLQTREKCLNIV